MIFLQLIVFSSFLTLSLPVYAEASTNRHFATMFIALVAVVCLIFLLAKLLKRLQGSSMGTRSKLKMICQLPLGPKERVVVLDVNGEQVLVGVTSMQITLLTPLKNPINEVEDAVSFTSQLNKVLKRDDGS